MPRPTGGAASTSPRRGRRRSGEAATPHTRKVALRTAMVMSPDRGGVFDVLLRLARWRLGGAVGGGRQFVSWIHDRDFVRAVAVPDRARGPRGPGQPRRARIRCPSATSWRRCARRGACSSGCPATKWMAGDRRLRPAHGHRAAAQEPPRRSRPAARGRVHVRLPRVASGREGSRGALEGGSHAADGTGSPSSSMNGTGAASGS